MQQRVAMTVKELLFLMASTENIRLGPVFQDAKREKKANKLVEENNPCVPEKKKQRDHDMKDN